MSNPNIQDLQIECDAVAVDSETVLPVTEPNFDVVYDSATNTTFIPDPAPMENWMVAQKTQPISAQITPETANMRPDLEQAGLFIEALTGNRNTPVTFQTFDDKGIDKELARVINGTLSEKSGLLIALNMKGAGIFVTVNETDLKGRETKNVIAVRSVFADFDSSDAIARAEAASAMLQPSIMVESSQGKRHLYWLTGDIPLGEFDSITEQLIATVGSDKAAKDLPRVLRVPGFFHCKGEPVMVKLIACHPERKYSRKQIMEKFAPEYFSPADNKHERAALDPLNSILNDQQLADVRTTLNAMKAKGLHISDVGLGNWHLVGLSLCSYGKIGAELFDEYSQGDVKYSPEACLRVLNQKRKAVAAGTKSAINGANIGELFKLAAEHGIENPAKLRGRNEAPSGNQTVKLTRASDITPKPISWLWKGYLAAGKMHILGGQPGTGKTTVAIALAATITVGGSWPDGTSAPAGNVLIWSGEDDPADTLVPRLYAAGANCDKVFFVDEVEDRGEKRTFDPAKDINALCRRAKEIGDVKFILVDPIVSAVAGDSHKNAEVRRGLQPLVELATNIDCALLGITHFTKGTKGNNPIERITGSLAFGALARVVLVATEQKEKSDPRLFLRAKSNIGPDGGGFEYTLNQRTLPKHPKIEASCAAWGNPVEGGVRELLNRAEDVDPVENKSFATRAARDFLLTMLEFGPLPVEKLQTEAKDANISWRTIERAKRALGIQAKKSGFKGQWEWCLPANMTFSQCAEEAVTN